MNMGKMLRRSYVGINNGPASTKIPLPFLAYRAIDHIQWLSKVNWIYEAHAEMKRK